MQMADRDKLIQQMTDCFFSPVAIDDVITKE